LLLPARQQTRLGAIRKASAVARAGQASRSPATPRRQRRRASIYRNNNYRNKKPPHRGGFKFRSHGAAILALRRLDICNRGLAGAAIFLGIEDNLLALDQSAHSGALQRGGVDEHILTAVIRLDEAKAFLVVVELYGARIH
jgi:hypothetical protein